MGQAKQRGTFEQRQAEGIKNKARLAEEQAEQLEKHEASLTPEQRRSRMRASLLLCTAFALVNSR